MIACINHPNRKSTFDSPGNLCDACHVMWMTTDYEEEDIFRLPKKGCKGLIKLRQADLMRKWKRYSFPQDHKAQWREVRRTTELNMKDAL